MKKKTLQYNSGIEKLVLGNKKVYYCRVFTAEVD